jgi:hypothetical protein
VNQNLLSQVGQIGTGAAFILFPLIFIFAFAVHPGLLRPRLLQPETIIQRARRNKLLQLAHSLVLLSITLLIVMAIHFMKILGQGSAAWAGWVGAVLAVLGAILLAADKGALCLTMSALDTVPEETFSAMKPGLLACIPKMLNDPTLGIATPAGWVPIQSAGLLQSNVLPRWQGTLFLIGVLLVGTPDGLEIINLSASILMATVLIPYGTQLIVSAF